MHIFLNNFEASPSILRGARPGNRHIQPLNYNYQMDRMTQLFGRALFIRYYKKEKDAGEFIGLQGDREGPVELVDLQIQNDADEYFEPEIGFEQEDLPNQFQQLTENQPSV